MSRLKYRDPETGQFITDAVAKRIDLLSMAEDFKRWCLAAVAAGRKDEARDCARRCLELKREALATPGGAQ